MESGTNLLRYLLLLFLFPTFYAEAYALSVSGDVNSQSAYLQQETSVTVQQGNSVIINREKKNATPVIILKVVPYQGKIAQLSWTSSDYSVPGTYYIERNDPILGWVIIKQLPYDTVLVYNDTISSPYCTATNVTYQIRFISVLDNTTSTPENAFLYDQTPPAVVQNLNASITTSGKPVITWTPVTGDDISGYMIQRDNGFSWDSITTVSAGSGQFIDNSISDVCNKSYRYVVITIDGCKIPSAPVYENVAVETIKLDASQPGQCDKFSTLVWNSINTIPSGLAGYKVFRSDGSTSTEVTDTQDTTYVDTFGFRDGVTYSYSLVAYSNNGLYSSTSCQPGWLYSGTILPDTVYITQVSVEDDSYIRVKYHLYPDGSVVKLILERSDNGGITFREIDSIPSGIGIVPQDYFFIDSTVNVHSQSYYYRLVAIDNCGFRTQSLNTSRSIWLQCSTSETQNSLEWNTYEYWLNGVKGYDVYRILIGEAETVILIDSVDHNTVTVTDLLSDYDHSKPACYRVEGTENPGNLLNNFISISNTCCIIKEPVLFMPNAFNPHGINTRFRPVPTPLYVEAQTFKMTIFSRWGQQLYETADMVNGWDGTVNGEAMPAGLYAYLLSYKSPEGMEYTKRGTVLLVR